MLKAKLDLKKKQLKKNLTLFCQATILLPLFLSSILAIRKLEYVEYTHHLEGSNEIREKSIRVVLLSEIKIRTI